MQQAAPPALVLTRTPKQQRRMLRRIAYLISTYACVTLLQAALGVALVSLQVSTAPSLTVWLWITILSLLVMVCCYSYIMWTNIRWHAVNRAMTDLQLVFTAQGVIYSSQSGSFTAPWTSVKHIRFRGKYVVVRAANWGGPVSGFGFGSRLVMPLAESGASAIQIRHAVYHLSMGTVQTVP